MSDVVRLDDYRPSDFLIDEVSLDIALHPSATRVVSTLRIRPNPAGRVEGPLVLDGDELVLEAILLDGAPLPPAAFEASPRHLTLTEPPRTPFTLTITTRLDPSSNTKLMGLYRSGRAYCTQCEAEGFRRITYFLDRPDVLSIYTTRIEAERADAPVLLGNGNLRQSGDVPGSDRHFAVWHDPHPKPCYLFAMVGGELSSVHDVFVTRSGHRVELGIYVEPGRQDRCGWAMDALKRSMRWDERVFGLEYDLDLFNVVAVSDFNMGAMENKGLNIFNDKYVLADPQTATDSDYASIEAIIAHEYLHNWTGNRITCRDWFQLCLKEGLTVYRDQEFTSDERSRAVKRIMDVRQLRTQQFAEDAGPLAHPVRPAAYREINNFYTATVYEKGAELVRMLQVWLGEDAFRRGMSLYLDRCDGTAATVEDFLACFEEASGTDLGQFKRWYEWAGTPRVTARGTHDAEAGTYRLDLTQNTPPTPGQPEKGPMVIPITAAFLPGPGQDRSDGWDEPRERLILLDQAEASVLVENMPLPPVPSLLRGFSAPVDLDVDLSNEDLLHLLRRDSDPFNRWQAGQTFATRLLVGAHHSLRSGRSVEHDPRYEQALSAFLDTEADRDPAFAALVATLPSEADLVREIGRNVDPSGVRSTRETLRGRIGAAATSTLRGLRARLTTTGPYDPWAIDAGRRSMRNLALDLIAAHDRDEGRSLALEQFKAADNLTDRFAALATLAHAGGDARDDALADFERRYGGEPIVLDKWFALQASLQEDGALDRVKELMTHPGFSLQNPNRVRALIGSFAATNMTQFHRADGAGYHFVADMILSVDRINPQAAARLLTAFRTWRMMDQDQRSGAERALIKISSEPNLSRDAADLVGRMLLPNPSSGSQTTA